MTAPLILAGLSLYGAVGAVCGLALHRMDRRLIDDMSFPTWWFLVALLWPVLGWAVPAVYVVRRLEAGDSERAERKRLEEEMMRREGIL